MLELHQPDRRMGRHDFAPRATLWKTKDGKGGRTFRTSTCRRYRTRSAASTRPRRMSFTLRYAVPGPRSCDHAHGRRRTDLDVDLDGGARQSADRQLFHRRHAWVGGRRCRRRRLSDAEAGRAVHRRRRTDLDRPAAKFRNRIPERASGAGRSSSSMPSSASSRWRTRNGAAILKTDRWRADVEADRGERPADATPTSRASASSTKPIGWVGGWGHGFNPGPGDGITSGTTDGGATWFDANDVGAFLNRFRFSGCRAVRRLRFGPDDLSVRRGPDIWRSSTRWRHLHRGPNACRPAGVEIMEIKAEVPANAQRLTVTIFDPRQTLVKVLADEKSPRAGRADLHLGFQGPRRARTPVPAISSTRVSHRRQCR